MNRTACLLLWLTLAAAARAELCVSTEFEGGSARNVQIDQAAKKIRFMPGGDPSRGWPCWWYLRVDGAAAGDVVTFEIAGSNLPIPQEGPNKGKPLPANWATPMRAAVSHDGKTWQHTEPGERRPNGMAWKVKAAGTSVWLAWGPPFTGTDATTLVKQLAAGHPFVKPFLLAKTRDGRDVPGVQVRTGERPDSERFGVWIQARQHAWESGGSWVCRGVAEWVTSDDPEAAWLREHAEIFIVPVMDVDHVATGDGGKDALPQDHNRDWSDAPHWPEVAAAQRRLGELATQQRLDVFLDLHNPAPGDLSSFFFTGEDSLMSDFGRSNRDRFLALASERLTGPIPHDPKPRASGVSYHPLWRHISNNWVITHGNPQTLALCLETSWNTPGSTIEGYLARGCQLAATVAAYLREDPRSPKR